MKPILISTLTSAIALAALAGPGLAHRAADTGVGTGSHVTVTVTDRAPSLADRIHARIAEESAEDE